MAPLKIVLVRHGESEWNANKLFCGWYDSNLTEKGKQQAIKAGKELKNAGYEFDVAYSSILTRAQNTLQLILTETKQPDIPIVKTWKLNERHFGDLTGQNKTDAAKQYGEELLNMWRRSLSFDVPLPPIEPNHPYYEHIIKHSRDIDGLAPEQCPKFETLKSAVERTLLFWNNTIVPQLTSGKRIIIASHDNPLRGIIQHLNQLTDDQIMQVNLPNAIPFVYTLNENLKPVSLEFLGDFENIKEIERYLAIKS